MDKTSSSSTSTIPPLSPLWKRAARRVYPHQQPIIRALTVITFLGVGVAAYGGLSLFAAKSGFTTHLAKGPATLFLLGGGGIALGTLGVRCAGVWALSRCESPVYGSVIYAHSYLDASYTHTGTACIADLVYTNPTLGFACIVDGSGHNNPRMRAALLRHFDPFIQGYAQGLQQREWQTIEEVDAYFKHKMVQINAQLGNPQDPRNQCVVVSDETKHNDLSNDLSMDTLQNPSLKPAMTFVQVVTMGDKRWLLTAQAGDTMFLVEFKSNVYQCPNQSSISSAGGLGVGSRIATHTTDISKATRIIGFSDGFGEFLSRNEVSTLCEEHPASQTLFPALKEAIVSREAESENLPTTGANGMRWKSYKADDPRHTDDLGGFVLNLRT